MYVVGCVFLKMVDNSCGFSWNVPHFKKHVKLPVGDFTMPDILWYKFLNRLWNHFSQMIPKGKDSFMTWYKISLFWTAELITRPIDTIGSLAVCQMSEGVAGI